MTDEEFFGLLCSHIIPRRNALKQGQKLVHYTSAESAYKIITGRQIWLRNTQMMNDFSEMQHGIDCLIEAWRSPEGKNLQRMLNNIREGFSDELAGLFDGHTYSIRQTTFLTSLSEHDDEEDLYGRLSMWRAYGGKAGVALILNETAFAAETDEMKVFSSPVFYQDKQKFCDWFEDWSKSILLREEEIRDMDQDIIKAYFCAIFRAFALCTKHPGFAEEREWRVFYSPMFEGDSDWIERSVEAINGLPQHVMKLHLKDNLERGISGVSPSTLIHKVLIGPCENPLQIRDAIIEGLYQADVQDPLDKVSMSLIPLRQY